jgi:hypothetical protein
MDSVSSFSSKPVFSSSLGLLRHLLAPVSWYAPGRSSLPSSLVYVDSPLTYRVPCGVGNPSSSTNPKGTGTGSPTPTGGSACTYTFLCYPDPVLTMIIAYAKPAISLGTVGITITGVTALFTTALVFTI